MIAVKLLNTLMTLSRFGGDVNLDLDRPDPDVVGLAARIAALVPGAWSATDDASPASPRVGCLRIEVAVAGDKTVAVNVEGLEEPPGWRPVPDGEDSTHWLQAGVMLTELAEAEMRAGLARGAGGRRAAAGRN